METNHKHHSVKKGASWQKYRPLFVLIGVTLLSSLAINWKLNGAFEDWMHYFMGLFLCAFAMLKLFDIAGFAEGFSMYDLVAQRFKEYGYIYPFIELGLGLAYLSFVFPIVTYSVTIAVMSVGVLGVMLALRKGLDVRCACMGTVLNVPLSTVTLTEDIGMGLMAAIMLFLHL